jgi:hypothetical protein
MRRFVAIDGPNHGIINCSPSPSNCYQLAMFGGFTPDSAICRLVPVPSVLTSPTLRRFSPRPRILGAEQPLGAAANSCPGALA